MASNISINFSDKEMVSLNLVSNSHNQFIL